MKSIAIIPARGGSKRIPRKNVREFFGKPIIAFSIEAAIQSGVFDEVIVSTDDENIKLIAQKYGASVPFLRSKENSNDFATTADVLIEVLDCLNSKDNNYDILSCIYPTAPFITADKIRDAYCEFIASNSSSMISVVPYSYPPSRGLIIENERVHFLYRNSEQRRTQDLQNIYHDAGQFYFARINDFYLEKSLYTENTIPYILSELEAQDIDSEEDWILAELKYVMLKER